MTSGAYAQSADALHARYAALRPQLERNHFDQPLYLESSDRDNALQGDVYARIDTHFSLAGPALRSTAHWCELLILHLNVKNCRDRNVQASEVIQLAVGRKFYQALTDTYAFEFKYNVAVANATYQRIILDAASGPMGTSNYHIVLEVTPLDATHSFLHLSYAYEYGAVARMAMQGYLSTIGRRKVGFTRVGTHSNGQPEYVGGQRGADKRPLSLDGRRRNLLRLVTTLALFDYKRKLFIQPGGAAGVGHDFGTENQRRPEIDEPEPPHTPSIVSRRQFSDAIASATSACNFYSALQTSRLRGWHPCA